LLGSPLAVNVTDCPLQIVEPGLALIDTAWPKATVSEKRIINNEEINK